MQCVLEEVQKLHIPLLHNWLLPQILGDHFEKIFFPFSKVNFLLHEVPVSVQCIQSMGHLFNPLTTDLVFSFLRKSETRGNPSSYFSISSEYYHWVINHAGMLRHYSQNLLCSWVVWFFLPQHQAYPSSLSGLIQLTGYLWTHIIPATQTQNLDGGSRR